MLIPSEGDESNSVTASGFVVPEFDESTKVVLKIRIPAESIDMDVESTRVVNENEVVFEGQDIPLDMDYVTLENSDQLRILVGGTCDNDSYFKVLSIDHNGQQIYP